MLIELHESIIKNNYLDDEKIRLCIEYIATSMREKKHIVIAKQHILVALARCEKLDRKARSVFLNVLRKLSIIGSIKKYLQGYIIVRADIENINLSNNNGITIYNIPVKYFDDSEKLMPFHIICEDESDCKFYTSLTNKYVKEKGYGFDMCFRGVHGGGEKTYLNYKTYLTEYNRNCLVIADSDKKDINCKVGDTAHRVEEVYNEFKNSFITDIHILKVREKENLITPELYNLCSNSKSAKLELKILEYIYNNNILKHIYIYSDIKDGIKYKEIFKNKINYNCILQYISECFKLGNNEKIIKKIKQQDLGIFGEYFCDIMEKYQTEEMNLSVISKNTIDLFEKQNKIIYEDKVINGIGYLINKFYYDILEGNLVDEINKKQKVKPKSKELQKEIIRLNENLEKSKTIFHIVDGEMRMEWEIIAKKIITWTCAIKEFIA